MNWTGKKIVVTGGASGIGRASVEAFLSGGAVVALLDKAETDLQHDQLHSIQVDLTDPIANISAVEEALARIEGCDVLVNVVGAATPVSIEDLEANDYRRAFDLNVQPAFLSTRAVLPYMKAEGRGSIINVSSVAAHQPGPGYSVYGATKGAIESMTRGMAVDVGQYGIRVNAVAPGPIDTPLGRQEIFKRGPEHQARQLNRVILGRIGQPEEVANVIEFIASDLASYMTGTVVVVDGGVSVRR